MRVLATRNCALVCVAALVLLLPSILFTVVGKDFGFALKALAQSTVFVGLVFIALGGARSVLWCSAVLSPLVPLECYFILTYGYPSSRHVISLLAESSLPETLEFLSGIAHWLVLSQLLLVSAFIAMLRLARRPASLRKPIRLGAALLLALGLTGFEIGRAASWAPQQLRAYSVVNSFPLGIAYRIGGYFKYARASRQVADRLSAYRFGATSSATDLTVILVVGESARPDHWGINGYARDTTPLLQRRRNVFSLPDLVTPWALTTYSTPILITRKDALSTDVFPERSIVGAVGEAGFRTYWFANQDGLKELSIHREEAASRKTYNMAVEREDVDAAFDGQMLPEIDAAIADGVGKRFVLVHMKGSHWDYHQRYPGEFRVFMPDQAKGGGATKYDPKLRDRLINAYDNSLRYTDFFLDHIIESLSRTSRPAVLVYVSDHGQALYDNGCKLFGHFNDTEINFRTEGLLWVSDTLIAQRPLSAIALQSNRRKSVSTQGTIFHTLADAAMLNIADLSSSLLSSSFLTRPRRVNVSAGNIDFDSAARIGACGLLSAPPPDEPQR